FDDIVLRSGIDAVIDAEMAEALSRLEHQLWEKFPGVRIMHSGTAAGEVRCRWDELVVRGQVALVPSPYDDWLVRQLLRTLDMDGHVFAETHGLRVDAIRQVRVDRLAGVHRIGGEVLGLAR